MSAWLEWWAKIAPGFTPIAALIAVFVAWNQLRLGRYNQQQTTAYAAWREFLKLAFEYPKYASGDLTKMSPDEIEQYKWFIGHLLWGAEEVLGFAAKDPVWFENIRLQMLPHRPYFRSDQDFQRELVGYSPAVQKLVERVKRTTGPPY